MNVNQLFDQFIGGSTRQNQQGKSSAAQGQPSGVADMLGKFTHGPAGGFAGGLAAGGLLGTLMGNKKMRKKAKKMGGGALAYGGSAVLGALALKAYQTWQSGHIAPAQNSPEQTGHAQAVLPSPEKFDPALMQDAIGQPMQLSLVKAMVAAANADGHIDAEEQKAVFDAVDTMSPDGESKAVIFDVLRNPPTVVQIAGYANGLVQASEIYLASRLAIDPDEPSERRYLDDLAKGMDLPAELVRQIELQVDPESDLTDGALHSAKDVSPAVFGRRSSAASRFSGRI